MFFVFFSCITIQKSTSYQGLLKKLPKTVKVIIFIFLCLPNLALCCGDIEKDPDPKCLSLRLCHSNLNDRTAHGSIKFLLLQTYEFQNN